jgi:hypothetical protein
MDGICAKFLCGMKNQIAPQVRIARRRWPKVHSMIGFSDMLGIKVGIRIDRDGFDVQTTRRSHNPAGNLAPICDQ